MVWGTEPAKSPVIFGVGFPLHNRYPAAANIGEDIVPIRFDPWEEDVYLLTWLNHEHASKFRYQLISYTVRAHSHEARNDCFLRPQKQAC